MPILFQTTGANENIEFKHDALSYIQFYRQPALNFMILKGLSGFFPKCWSCSVEGVDEGG